MWANKDSLECEINEKHLKFQLAVIIKGIESDLTKSWGRERKLRQIKARFPGTYHRSSLLPTEESACGIAGLANQESKVGLCDKSRGFNFPSSRVCDAILLLQKSSGVNIG